MGNVFLGTDINAHYRLIDDEDAAVGGQPLSEVHLHWLLPLRVPTFCFGSKVLTFWSLVCFHDISNLNQAGHVANSVCDTIRNGHRDVRLDIEGHDEPIFCAVFRYVGQPMVRHCVIDRADPHAPAVDQHFPAVEVVWP
jgi:hypothetical protein